MTVVFINGFKIIDERSDLHGEQSSAETLAETYPHLLVHGEIQHEKGKRFFVGFFLSTSTCLCSCLWRMPVKHNCSIPKIIFEK